LVARNRRKNLFVRHAQTEVCALAIFQAKHSLPHHVPSPGFFPNFGRMQRRQKEFLPADCVHLLAYYLHGALSYAPAQGEKRIDASAKLTYVACAQKKAMRNHLCVRRDFTECWNKIF